MNPKLPVAVIEARGRTHLTRAEREARRREEVAPATGDATPPRSLTTKRQRERFAQVAALLQALGIWDAADADELARYVLASEAYDIVMRSFMKACRAGDAEAVKAFAPRQKELHRQAHELASSLGLNVTSRARIAVPPRLEKPEVDF